MSIRVITLTFDADMGSAARNGVMVALADGANDDGTHTYKSRETIARMANVSIRTVPRICAQFLNEGLILEAGSGPKGTVRYHINIDALKALNPCHHAIPDTVSPLTPRPKTPDTTPPEPSLIRPNIKKRLRVIPNDWVPDTPTGKTAERLSKLTADQIENMLETFHDHHTAKQTKSADFNANWRTWVRRSEEFAAKRKSNSVRKGKAGANQTHRNQSKPSSLLDAMGNIYQRDEQRRSESAGNV